MKKVFLAVSLLLAFAASNAALPAADEGFPLEMKTGKDPRAEAGIPVDWRRLETGETVPKALSLPESPALSLYFAKWVTPMVKEGFLWMAVGRSSADSAYDTLYIDANCNGSLADETAVKAYQAQPYETLFGPVKVTFPNAEDPSEYYLNVRCSRLTVIGRAAGGASQRPVEQRDFFELWASPACWREGTVKEGDKEYRCVISDYNSNGAFNDTSMNPEQMDRIAISAGNEPQFLGLGKYFCVADTFFRVELPPSGARISLTSAANAPMGTVRTGKDITLFSITGENGQLVFDPNTGPVLAPAGQWVTSFWGMEREDASGAKWRLFARGSPESRTFEVTEGKETALDIGESLVSRLSVGPGPGGYEFEVTLTSKWEERVILVWRNNTPFAPKLRITNADGTYDKMVQFKPG